MASGSRRWGVQEGYQRWARQLVFPELRDGPVPEPAAGWARKEGAAWLEAGARALAARLQDAPGRRWLDAGCGTGTWAAQLAHDGRAVGALDRSRLLLWEARRRLSAQGIACRGLEQPETPEPSRPAAEPLRLLPEAAPFALPGLWPRQLELRAVNGCEDGDRRAILSPAFARRRQQFEGPVGEAGTVTLRWNWLEAMPFPRRHFHGVVAAFAFCHVRAKEALARQLARVLRPGGYLFILDQGPDWDLAGRAPAVAPALTLPYGTDQREAEGAAGPGAGRNAGQTGSVRIATYPRPLRQQLAGLRGEGFTLEDLCGWDAAGSHVKATAGPGPDAGEPCFAAAPRCLLLTWRRTS